MKPDLQKAILAAAGRYIRKLLEPFEPRMKAVEDRVGELPALVEKAVGAIPAPKDGASITAADVEPLLQKMVDALPKPRDPDPVVVDLGAVAAEAVKDLLASPGLKAICDLVATEAVAALPPAQKGDDGKSVSVDEVLAALAPRIEDRIEAAIAKAVLDVERRAQGVLERAVAAIPKPKDGKDGADFADVTFDYDGERTLTIRGKGGDIVKTMPIPLDRGYWREGMSCEKGDIATHDGSAWIALRDTKAKPSLQLAEDWRLFARRGKDGPPGEKGAPYVPPSPVTL